MLCAFDGPVVTIFQLIFPPIVGKILCPVKFNEDPTEMQCLVDVPPSSLLVIATLNIFSLHCHYAWFVRPMQHICHGIRIYANVHVYFLSTENSGAVKGP